MKEQFIKRLKSFAWRVGMMFIALLVAFASENLAGFGLSAQTTIILGLVLGEVSKFLNSLPQES